jgi:DNA-binding IclR family transcriptional regulator
MEQRLAGLLRFVADNDGASSARACKQLGLARSELQRLLVVLGEDEALGGLGLVATGQVDGRLQLRLTPEGRDWLDRNA